STERAPSAVPKLSLKSGLVHTITKDPDPVDTTADAWFWTAIDFRTGTTKWKRLLGTGTLYNNHYAGVALGPKGRGYIGVIGGRRRRHALAPRPPTAGQGRRAAVTRRSGSTWRR